MLIIVDTNNQKMVFNAIPEDVIDLLYGEKSEQIKGLIHHLKKSITQNSTNWKAPFAGVFLGDWFFASDYELSGIVRQAIEQTSSLSHIELEESQVLNSAKQKVKPEDSWTDLVKNTFVLNYPDFADAFDVQIKFSDHIKLTYDFVTPSYTANIVDFKVASTEKVTKSIFDMQLLASESKKEKMDFIIQTPNSVDLEHYNKNRVSIFYEKIQLLESLLSSCDVKVFKTDSHEEAAQRMQQLGAA